MQVDQREIEQERAFGDCQDPAATIDFPFQRQDLTIAGQQNLMLAGLERFVDGKSGACRIDVLRP